MPVAYDRITTTIEREWLAEIIAGTKKIEYRQINPIGLPEPPPPRVDDVPKRLEGDLNLSAWLLTTSS